MGYWTEIKLRIIKDYASAYAIILHNQKLIKHFAYIDGFAGAGRHISRNTRKSIHGSPAIALDVTPQFSHYHFIDLDGERADQLKELSKERNNVSVYEGDCNDILLRKIFPTCLYKDYCRALCILDPYDLNPNWEVVQTAGHMKSVEIFLNFMIMDANRNILKENPEKVSPSQIDRMNTFWGDESWKKIAYKEERDLFNNVRLRKAPKEDVINAYKQRLEEVAGFKYVPDPIPMRNNRGVTIYYLFFASHNRIGSKITTDIFKKYRIYGIGHGD